MAGNGKTFPWAVAGFMPANIRRIHQEPYLRLFLTDGEVPMDNNSAEQTIRPFTIGRKNFVLIDSSNGARASAIIYSLVETAKANLLPWSPTVQEKCPSRFKKS